MDGVSEPVKRVRLLPIPPCLHVFMSADFQDSDIAILGVIK